jgi:preprotein translocase subunit SecD
LWIGPIHACRDTAESAVADAADQGPFPGLTITLRPDLRAELQRETERLVGSAMPIRLDGQVISKPIVREPLTAGVLSLAGQSAEETAAMQAAVREPC